MATYVFVADQLHLPKGLNNVTLTGTLNNGVTTFASSKAVLNVPYASHGARARCIATWAAGRSIGPCPRSRRSIPEPWRSPRQRHGGEPFGQPRAGRTWPSSRSATPRWWPRPQTAKKAARVETPRPVVSIHKRNDGVRGGASTKLPPCSGTA